jgi:hypothetical protein
MNPFPCMSPRLSQMRAVHWSIQDEGSTHFPACLFRQVKHLLVCNPTCLFLYIESVELVSPIDSIVCKWKDEGSTPFSSFKSKT